MFNGVVWETKQHIRQPKMEAWLVSGGGGGGLQYRVMIEGAMEDAGLTKSQVEVLHHVDEHFFHIRTLKLHILGYN